MTKGLGRFKPLVAVLGALVVALSLPPFDVRRIRGAASWVATPLWSQIVALRSELSPEEALKERVRQLELERTILIQRLKEATSEVATPLQSHGVKARVLAREPGAWNRFLWVDAGRETVGEDGPLQKQSPVVYGDAVVGLIEYVGRRQSLVRLITDPQCCLAVQVAAEGSQGIQVASQRLQRLLRTNSQVDETLRCALQPLLMQLSQEHRTTVAWRGSLKGSGNSAGGEASLVGEFYPSESRRAAQHADADLSVSPTYLHEGHILHPGVWDRNQHPSAGALLVTTGLDGIFPAGLKVGYIESTAADNRRPEQVAWPAPTFTALPAVETLDDLQWLTILAPRGFSGADVPRPSWEQHVLPAALSGR